MFNSIQRCKDLFQKLGYKTILLDGILWIGYQKMIVPVGPVSDKYEVISAEQKNDLLRFFKECALIRTGMGFIDMPDAWYVIICDQPHTLLDLSANTRSNVRRGLRDCIIRKIDAKFMAEHAWTVFSSGFEQYKNDWLKVSEEKFRKNMALTDGFDDIIHYWGVFDKQNNEFIAYAQNYLYDKTEVNYSIMRLNPNARRRYASHILYYEMNRYYLNEEKFTYTNAGFRSLLHDTNIQEHLTSKFIFKKQPVDLKIYYRPFIGRCVSLTYPYRHLLGKIYRPLAALYKLEEMNRSGYRTKC